ncbi:hypothetical protein [Promicromonospora sp. NPDC090134]|uniref:hypothetical protein n=1 Tax=Promicromonospora sp. NPDC090134 TaxID=3364408 RepID=UPI0037F213CC
MGFADDLVPNRQGNDGLPGLRLERTLSRDTGHYDLTIGHILRHLPSGGQIVVTNDAHARIIGKDDQLQHERRIAPYDLPVLPHEHDLLRGTPRMSSDARVLLAAVICRLSTREPSGGWALGNRHDTPSRHWRAPFVDDTQTLTGEGDHWVLRWSGYPPMSDLVRALTDPTIGLAETTVTRDQKAAVLQFGTASLHLQERA